MNVTQAFELLGLPLDSEPDEIRTRWRELAAKHHPDKGGELSQFQKLAAAHVRAMNYAAVPKPCAACHGTKKVQVTRGFSSAWVSCPACTSVVTSGVKGPCVHGRPAGHPCPHCLGIAFSAVEKKADRCSRCNALISPTRAARFSICETCEGPLDE